MKLQWEQLEQERAGYMARAKVFGGWLVVHADDVQTPIDKGYDKPINETGYEWRTSICFMPDLKHEWK